MHYADRLSGRIKERGPICIGLDPLLAKLPEGLPKTIEGIQIFCRRIIDAVNPIAAILKPQLAYFEVLGWEGMKLFYELCSYAQKQGLMVIADGKRNDIGSTCEAYADAYLSASSPIDALTVSPYLGSDGVTPFIERAVKNDRGIYVLVKTSNESSGELQDLPVGDEVVHEYLAQLVESWATGHLGNCNLSCVGAVVGATYPEELTYLRTLMPHVPFLIPGYGAQGGTAADCRPGFLADGQGAVVNSSRAILYASKGNDWQEAAQKAALAMQKEFQNLFPKS